MIIKEVMEYIIKEINAEKNVGNITFASLGNIARLESGETTTSSSSRGKIVLTVVNIEEENTLKNNTHYVRTGDSIEKRNPIVFINLYVLISSPTEQYDTALSEISETIEFFQGKNVFTRENNTTSEFPEQIEKIMMELFTLNFEQVNHLWGILGGKYLPSVMYKLRLVPILSKKKQPVQPIEEITANGNLAN
jgi:Pvc16 N-terminal domain